MSSKYLSDNAGDVLDSVDDAGPGSTAVKTQFRFLFQHLINSSTAASEAFVASAASASFFSCCF